jgi:hypothetical protein
MKKLLLFSFLIGFAATITAQVTPVQTLGGPKTRLEVRGQLIVDSTLWVPIRDTNYIPPFEGALDYRLADRTFYGYANGRWNPLTATFGFINGNITNQTNLRDSLLARQYKLTVGTYTTLGPNNVNLDTANYRKVDTLFKINDSTVGYLLNGRSYSVNLQGGHGAGGGSGVTNVGNLSPLFTSNVTGSSVSFAQIVQNTNTVFAGPASGASAVPTFRSLVVNDLPLGIPNGYLSNPNMGFSIGNSGTDANWSATPVPLGGTAVLNLPSASGTVRGLLTPTDWTSFNNKVTSVNGITGVVVTKNADSIKKLPVDTTSNRNNYVLTFDSLNHKWFLGPGGSGGGGGLGSVGALDGNGADTKGASISGSTLFMQSASSSVAGLWNTGVQTLPGNKTLTGTLALPGTVRKVPVSGDSILYVDAAAKVWKAKIQPDTLTLRNIGGDASYDSLAFPINNNTGLGFKKIKFGTGFTRTQNADSSLLLTVSGGGGGGNNIYNTDSVLASNRSVGGNGKTLSLGVSGDNLARLNLFSASAIGLYGIPTYSISPVITDANFTGSANQSVFKLPVITANRVFTPPTASPGGVITIWNANTATTALWTLPASTFKDASGNTLNALFNNGYYNFYYDGTNWIQQFGEVKASKQTITTGGTQTIQNSNSTVNVDPATTLASMILNLPTAFVDNQVVNVNFGGTITSGAVVTAFTLSGNGNPVIGTVATTPIAGQNMSFRWRASSSKWYVESGNTQTSSTNYDSAFVGWRNVDSSGFHIGIQFRRKNGTYVDTLGFPYAASTGGGATPSLEQVATVSSILTTSHDYDYGSTTQFYTGSSGLYPVIFGTGIATYGRNINVITPVQSNTLGYVSYTSDLTDEIIPVEASLGDVEIVLTPPPSGNQVYRVKRIDNATNGHTVTVKILNGVQTFDYNSATSSINTAFGVKTYAVRSNGVALIIGN